MRKAAATVAAENGATEAELNAIFGWSGSQMARMYTESANRSRLALRSIEKLQRSNDDQDLTHSLSTPHRLDAQHSNRLTLSSYFDDPAALTPRQPAIVTQADVARAICAARDFGATAVEIKPDGTIVVRLAESGEAVISTKPKEKEQ